MTGFDAMARARHPLQQPPLPEGRPPGPGSPPAQHFLIAFAAVARQAGWDTVLSDVEPATAAGQNMINRLTLCAAIGALPSPGLEYLPLPIVSSDQLGPVDQRLHLQRSAGHRLHAKPPILVMLATKPRLMVKFSFISRNQTMEPLALTASQEFEIERFSRAIDTTSDVATLRAIAKQLLQAWMTQKAAASWAMRQALLARPVRNN